MLIVIVMVVMIIVMIIMIIMILFITLCHHVFVFVALAVGFLRTTRAFTLYAMCAYSILLTFPNAWRDCVRACACAPFSPRLAPRYR